MHIVSMEWSFPTNHHPTLVAASCLLNVPAGYFMAFAGCWSTFLLLNRIIYMTLPLKLSHSSWHYLMCLQQQLVSGRTTCSKTHFKNRNQGDAASGMT
jgi:hypothetical protein